MSNPQYRYPPDGRNETETETSPTLVCNSSSYRSELISHDMPCFRPQETFNLFSVFLHHTTHVPPPGKSTPHQSPRRCQCMHRVLTLYGIATRRN